MQVVSRRSFFVPTDQSDDGSVINLRYGQTSRDIVVTAPWADTLKRLVGPVTLTPYVNAQLGFAVFTPPVLTWTAGSPSSQTIKVTVRPQNADIVPAAFTVNWIMSGAATDIQYFARTPAITNFPTFTVDKPTILFFTAGSRGGQASGALAGTLTALVGEVVTVTMALEELPPTGFKLTISAPDVLVTIPGKSPM